LVSVQAAAVQVALCRCLLATLLVLAALVVMLSSVQGAAASVVRYLSLVELARRAMQVVSMSSPVVAVVRTVVLAGL
jgi:hypothetical protein